MYITYQKDQGNYASELSYSVADGMASASSLFHFGLIDKNYRENSESSINDNKVISSKRIDEDPDGDGSTGLKGHFSLGGEIYASAQEKSAGGGLLHRLKILSHMCFSLHWVALSDTTRNPITANSSSRSLEPNHRLSQRYLLRYHCEGSLSGLKV